MNDKEDIMDALERGVNDLANDLYEKALKKERQEERERILKIIDKVEKKMKIKDKDAGEHWGYVPYDTVCRELKKQIKGEK